MAIRLASELNLSPTLQCPLCKKAIIAAGRDEPFATDASGHVYCPEHGAMVEPGYLAAIAEFQDDRARRRQAGLDKLEALLREDDRPDAHG